MKELVVNKCYGGFGLSHEAIMRYAELVGMTLYSEEDYSFYHYYKVPVDEYKTMLAEARKTGSYGVVNGLYFTENDIDREDPILIQVVKELGEKASGQFSDLTIVEIPDDVQYEIQDYDGVETVAEVHRTW